MAMVSEQKVLSPSGMRIKEIGTLSKVVLGIQNR
jgi:hypothetical protein